MRPLSAKVWVTGQVTPGQVRGLRDAGFTCVVNHRPDNEEPDQPLAAEIARTCDEAGMTVVHAPARGLPDAAAVAATRAALDGLGEGGKAVFFCRSGMRSAAAWAMAERLAGGDPDTLREAALAAGYDLGRVPL
ncbi:beta-lactamase hydrolase domain-containing protein [Brevundimonas sp.]|uniref:beta-lactamase hydrolase domain-containing protein n=1 Tax=Brevundimonas sp. TaxID=1871086 RepID=UPI002D63B3F6|nr:sulfur transferase domain-containing protein [Brevundimonas sp.]HYC75845.1 sulfur transferase domain-containing protein [Brevundimonas sp.]